MHITCINLNSGTYTTITFMKEQSALVPENDSEPLDLSSDSYAVSGDVYVRVLLLMDRYKSYVPVVLLQLDDSQLSMLTLWGNEAHLL